MWEKNQRQQDMKPWSLFRFLLSFSATKYVNRPKAQMASLLPLKSVQHRI